MARARTQPAANEADEPKGKTTTLTYNGPEGQVSQAVGKPLIPGESYELPEKLAKQLLASSSHWEE